MYPGKKTSLRRRGPFFPLEKTLVVLFNTALGFDRDAQPFADRHGPFDEVALGGGGRAPVEVEDVN